MFNNFDFKCLISLGIDQHNIHTTFKFICMALYSTQCMRLFHKNLTVWHQRAKPKSSPIYMASQHYTVFSLGTIRLNPSLSVTSRRDHLHLGLSEKKRWISSSPFCVSHFWSVIYLFIFFFLIYLNLIN